MPRNYVKTGRPPGRPKKFDSIISALGIEGPLPRACPIPELPLDDLKASAKLLAQSKEARMEYLAEWMMTTRDVRVAELLLRASGDLMPVAWYQQNNFQQPPQEAPGQSPAIETISNGRGPGEWRPPAQIEEPDLDPIIDAPADTSPIPVPMDDAPMVSTADDELESILEGL